MAHPVGDSSRQFMPSFSRELITEINSMYFSQVRPITDQILQGTVLVIDPSAASLSSLPAYCVLTEGERAASGVIEVPTELLGKRWTIDKRLYCIGKFLREKFPTKFDVLAVEYLYHTPQANTVMASFQHNIMSHGTIYGSVSANNRVDVSPWNWHKNRPVDYVKSDLVDVELMALTLVNDARRLHAFRETVSKPARSTTRVG